MYLLTLPRRLSFHSVMQDYTKTTTTNFHKIAGKVAGRAGCALCGAKPSGQGHDNMNAYCANFPQNFLNSCTLLIHHHYHHHHHHRNCSRGLGNVKESNLNVWVWFRIYKMSQDAIGRSQWMVQMWREVVTRTWTRHRSVTDTLALVPKCPKDTLALTFWYQTVLGLKCFGSEVSVHRVKALRGFWLSNCSWLKWHPACPTGSSEVQLCNQS